MGHGTVADEIKGRAAPARERAGAILVDRGGGRALPLLHRRRRALHGARDLDGGAGGARLRHRARVRRVHAVPRRPRLHRALDRAHAPLARALPGLAGRARAATTRPSTAISQGGVYEDLRRGSTRRSPRASRAPASRSAARSGEDKAQMYEVVELGDRRAGPDGPQAAPPARDRRDRRPRARRRARDRHVRLRDADAARPPRHGDRARPGEALARRPDEGPLEATPTSRSWRAARARPARAATRAPTCTTCSRRAS